ncbi:MAG: type II toxin-antitoxin system VapC family toxin [Euzebyales bacterium]|nr:type II toxin-antitoxin system VapC family toxin [Euzebyales bacterium]
MGAVLLDTTVLIDALRGRPAAQRLLGLRTAGDQPCVCAINAEEVRRGLRQHEQEVARRLLDGLRTVPLTLREGWQAGQWRQRFAARGTTLNQADCLIAAAALTVGARLATGNPRHFPMSEVAVEHWPVGE